MNNATTTIRRRADLQEKMGESMDGKELLQKHVVVEGHRDVYDPLDRTSIGESMPIREEIAPRMISDGINLYV